MGTTSPAGFVKTLNQDFKDNGPAYFDNADAETQILVDNITEESGLETGNSLVDYVIDLSLPLLFSY